MKASLKAFHVVVILQIFNATAVLASEPESPPPGFTPRPFVSVGQLLTGLATIARAAANKLVDRALTLLDFGKTVSEIGQALGKGDLGTALGQLAGAGTSALAATGVGIGALGIGTAVTAATGNPVLGAAAATGFAVVAAPAVEGLGQAVGTAVTEGLNDL